MWKGFSHTGGKSHWVSTYSLKLYSYTLLSLCTTSNSCLLNRYSLLRLSCFFTDDEDEEEYINFTVIDEFHEKFGPAVSF